MYSFTAFHKGTLLFYLFYSNYLLILYYLEVETGFYDSYCKDI